MEPWSYIYQQRVDVSKLTPQISSAEGDRHDELDWKHLEDIRNPVEIISKLHAALENDFDKDARARTRRGFVDQLLNWNTNIDILLAVAESVMAGDADTHPEWAQEWQEQQTTDERVQEFRMLAQNCKSKLNTTSKDANKHPLLLVASQRWGLRGLAFIFHYDLHKENTNFRKLLRRVIHCYKDRGFPSVIRDLNRAFWDRRTDAKSACIDQKDLTYLLRINSAASNTKSSEDLSTQLPSEATIYSWGLKKDNFGLLEYKILTNGSYMLHSNGKPYPHDVAPFLTSVASGPDLNSGRSPLDGKVGLSASRKATEPLDGQRRNANLDQESATSANALRYPVLHPNLRTPESEPDLVMARDPAELDAADAMAVLKSGMKFRAFESFGSVESPSRQKQQEEDIYEDGQEEDVADEGERDERNKENEMNTQTGDKVAHEEEDQESDGEDVEDDDENEEEEEDEEDEIKANQVDRIGAVVSDQVPVKWRTYREDQRPSVIRPAPRLKNNRGTLSAQSSAQHQRTDEKRSRMAVRAAAARTYTPRLNFKNKKSRMFIHWISPLKLRNAKALKNFKAKTTITWAESLSSGSLELICVETDAKTPMDVVKVMNQLESHIKALRKRLLSQVLLAQRGSPEL